MIQRLAALAALAVGAVLAPAAVADEFGGLPPGEGREDVYDACSACHSIMLVTQQGMSRRRWDKTLVWMVEAQGMPDYPPEERELILDYLAAHFGEGATAQPAEAWAAPATVARGAGSPAPAAAAFMPPSPFNTGQ